jgi:DNA-binding transcriptional LysR family regulator
MNFRQIEAFKTVMASGTTTRAAEILRVSQPAISRLLADLERATRLKLFDRNRGRIRPTAEGHAFYQEVRRAFIGLEQLHFAAENIRSFASGTVRVASLPVLGHAFLPRIVGAFCKEHPGLSVLLHIRSSEAVKDLVASGQFDLGFAADEIDRAGVRARIFSAPDAVGILPAGHALAEKAVLTPEDLADQRFVSLASEDAARARIDRLFEAAKFRRRMVVETQYSVTICNLVRSGAGVALINPMALEGLDPTGLVIRPFHPPVQFRTLLITPPNGLLSQAGHAFVTIAERGLGQGAMSA